jgi:hypothetical protein
VGAGPAVSDDASTFNFVVIDMAVIALLLFAFLSLIRLITTPTTTVAAAVHTNIH